MSPPEGGALTADTPVTVVNSGPKRKNAFDDHADAWKINLRQVIMIQMNICIIIDEELGVLSDHPPPVAEDFPLGRPPSDSFIFTTQLYSRTATSIKTN